MCLITLQGTCHKSCHKSGAATRKWSRLWSFCNSICTSLAFGEKTSLCIYNVPILRQQLVSCFENETMYPFPKQHKRSFKIQKTSTVTHFLLFMSYSMPIWKRRSSGWVYEMLWVVPPEVRKNTTSSVYKQSSQFVL